MLVSACLLGINCKYSGGNNRDERVCGLIKNHKIIPICPEQLGGLTTPRLPCEIQEKEGKRFVYRNDGIDLTAEFIKGAEETLEIAKLFSQHTAILKSKSPSCGSQNIYDGSFSGKVVEGEGFTAKLLKENGIIVYDEENYFVNNVDR
jgi:uncharacterized protein YbbK (DUF523 family)